MRVIKVDANRDIDIVKTELLNYVKASIVIGLVAASTEGNEVE